MKINNIHSTAIQVDHLTIGYGDHPLVRDISFEMAPGECVLLAGANGTGKTTLLKVLAEEASSAGILLIPTNIPKVKGFSVESFIHTGCYKESDWRGRISEEVEMKMEEALDILGIQELKGRDISTLSDGEFKKACLAVGLTRRAEVLLLDEPTAFLDVENRISVLETLREVARKTGAAILFSSHDLHDALPVVDRVFVLTRDGRFVVSEADNKEAVLRAAFPNLSTL